MLDKGTLDLLNVFLKVKINPNENLANEDIEIKKLISSSILNNIILSKKIFKRNSMINKFLKLYFSMDLSKYSFSSRTIICGKITKYIYNLDDEEELTNILNAIYNILSKIKNNKDVLDADMYDVIMGIKL